MIQIETEWGVLEAEAITDYIHMQYGYSEKGHWRVSNTNTQPNPDDLSKLLQVCKREMDMWIYKWIHVSNNQNRLQFAFIAPKSDHPSHTAWVTEAGRQQLIDLIESVLGKTE